MTTSPEAGVQLMRRLVFEVQQDLKLDLIDELWHPDFVDHTGGAGQGRSSVPDLLRYLHAAFQNIKMHIDQCVCDGTTIATNKTLTGTHVGDFMGKPPDGKRKEMRIMDFVTLKEGKIVEHWACLGAEKEV